MNKELLLQVADAIEANPQHFDMHNFVNYCGTTACIAGFALMLSNNYVTPKRLLKLEKILIIFYSAESILELSVDESWVLFYLPHWASAAYRVAYKRAKSSERAKIAADYVRWFVATDAGAKELETV